MKTIARAAVALAAAGGAGLANADITFYEHDNFYGRQFTVHEPVDNFREFGFNDRASSVVVSGRPWEVCDDTYFRGTCVILRPGNYPSLSAMDLNERISSAREAGERRGPPPQMAPAPLPGEVTFYERPYYRGRSFDTQGDVRDFGDYGFNDRASSAVVIGDRWEVCDDVAFHGHCVVLRPGNYPDLRAMGLDNTISSVRQLPHGAPVADSTPWAPPAAPAYDWRVRPSEQLYRVNVTSTRAVYGTPQQQCWVERQQVPVDRPATQLGSTVIGGVLGGILGHEIIHGRGGAVVGAIGGAAIGNAIGANAQAYQDVHRCSAPVQGPPLYWDTTYEFRGVEHHMQSTQPPGPTVTVNGYGEPRMQ
ncbi:MAG TPA: beta/gamma crystallin family protein [Burkholderiaceae bacterium]